MGSELGVTADSKPEVRLGGVGIFWICFASVWTILLVSGMAFLVSKRHMPILRIRGLGLSLCAITLLHLYWISVQLGYIYAFLAPGDAQYWIMGTYLPFGIGLFHASNSRFLHIAQAQKRYAQRTSVLDAPVEPKQKNKGLLGRFSQLDYTSKVVVLVGSGMLFQLFLTVFMYLISRKWHSSWGIPGTEVHGTEMEQKMEMGRGWEWWPSVFWQVLWAWIVAPIILWKARNIHDTQGWRTQTIACALSNLHATPMWLIALNVSAMDPVNKYFIPPQWIAVSIMLMEIFTVFLPCWEVMRHQILRQETLDTIAQWECNNKVSTKGNRSVNSSATAVESVKSGWKSTNGSVRSSSNESILTMSALEYVLERNPEPLQQFSALRDFSGENIAFLTSVADWKTSLPASVRNPDSDMPDETQRQLVRERFNRALRIYAEFISVRDAEFPINISSPQLKKLEAVFENSARAMYGEKREVDPAVPFDVPDWDKLNPPTSSHSLGKEGASEKLGNAGQGDRVQCYWGEIPEDFDEAVFDDAEKSIKYLVLTNTWPKFVRDRRSSMDSFNSSGNAETGDAVAIAR